MLNVDAVFFYTFVFSILVISRVLFKFLGTLLQKEPKPLVLSNRELIFTGLVISYLITYLNFK
jgi:hypothetical protein